MSEDLLGYRFKDGDLLVRALTHRSFLAGPRAGTSEGERLEFLGDAMLGFVVADWLFHQLPGATEGDLTRRKQEVVRRETLESAARRLGLGERLRLGAGEEATGGREKPSLLGDAFEAVLGRSTWMAGSAPRAPSCCVTWGTSCGHGWTGPPRTPRRRCRSTASCDGTTPPPTVSSGRSGQRTRRTSRRKCCSTGA